MSKLCYTDRRVPFRGGTMRVLRAWIMAMAFAVSAALAPALAAPVAGQDDPAFKAAVSDWLQASEGPALTALSQLAAQGNAAAQVFLAIIDTTPAYQGDWLTSLPRAQRIAVLRAPGGLSGQNWMRVAAEREPLAQAFLTLWDGDATADVVLDFARLGERRVAHMAARQLFSRERRGFGAIGDDPAFPPSLLPLAIRDWQDDDPARAKAALAGLAPGDPGRKVVGLGDPSDAALLLWAQDHPLGANLLKTLGTLCPGSALRAEDLAAYLSQAGGFWALAWLGPPSERLVDPARYAASPQAAQTALRLLRAGPLAGPQAIAASPCIAALLQARAAP